MSARLALVTRPAEDAGPLVAALNNLGIESLVEPLLAVVPHADAARRLGDLACVRALAFTSANGVRAFAAACPRRDLPVFAVGGTTAEAARRAGFARVDSAGGDVEALASLIAARLKPGEGTILHAAGETVAGDLAGRLAVSGLAVRRIALYDARPAEALSPACRAALASGRIGAAIFFSPRTARTFVRLVHASGLAPSCCAVVAFCLSPAVAEAAAALAWSRMTVAAAPNRDSLIAAIAASKEGEGEGPSGRG